MKMAISFTVIDESMHGIVNVAQKKALSYKGNDALGFQIQDIDVSELDSDTFLPNALNLLKAEVKVSYFYD